MMQREIRGGAQLGRLYNPRSRATTWWRWSFVQVLTGPPQLNTGTVRLRPWAGKEETAGWPLGPATQSRVET